LPQRVIARRAARSLRALRIAVLTRNETTQLATRLGFVLSFAAGRSYARSHMKLASLAVEYDRAPLSSDEKRTVGEGLFRKCSGCGVIATTEERATRFHVCDRCGFHHPMSVVEWRTLLLDDAKHELWDEHLAPLDPLQFEDAKTYPERVARARKATGATEAIFVGRAAIEGCPIAFGCFNFSFMGGSMGSVVGERITRLFERATSEELPVVLVHASGGARMQEGILSLMQMAKTVSALARFRRVRRPYISVLLNNTTGGVAASTAFLGDINIAEPNANIGFAGARVIESTLRISLPENFQTSEFLVSHGMVDIVIPRTEMRGKIATLLKHLVPA
jgi:acetyl-CoA carboxylase carboxyl transferase subunit beta